MDENSPTRKLSPSVPGRARTPGTAVPTPSLSTDTDSATTAIGKPGKNAARGAAPIHRPDPRGMTSGILVFCRWLQNLSIGMWMGALVTLAAMGPYALKYFNNSHVDAGKFLGPLIKYWTEAGIACGILYLLLMLIHDALWRRYHATTAGELLVFLKFVLVMGIIGICTYLLLRVTPTMEGIQKTAQVVDGALSGDAGKSFDRWHKFYEQMSGGMFLGGAGLLLLTHMSRRRR